MNRAASQLGKLAAGKLKNFSADELAKRTARLRAAQKERAKTQRDLRRANAPHKPCGTDDFVKPKT
jgi:hypothetical protein